ncbi:MAG TPA: 23S rRNA (adenine(2503)-C(2))-methyltransferase RlmN [Bacillota bacterium]|nr:23S rRNA (adenine(2503)-C(2))-methyltransferase RlmN [Bacillota bacterium]
MVDLKRMLPDEMVGVLAAQGEPAYRAGQLFAWIQGRGARSFEAMSSLPRGLRERLAEIADLGVLQTVTRQADPHDGTVKYLLRLRDGNTIETVRMSYSYGYSACVSSQVGCHVGCRFCASAIGGLVRNLTASEMIEQLILLNHDLAQEEEGARIARVVVMGMGEPMENLPEVLRFLRLAHEPDGCGIGWRHMTVSTSGVVPGIDALAAEDLPITLAVSLHAPNDEVRSRLVPLGRRYPIAELMPACRRYVEATGRRLTFEYVLIGGVNDLPEHARELGRLLRGMLCHVNLIPLNPVAGRGLEPSPPQAMAIFQRILREQGITATLRRQLGTAIDAACGQLRRRVLEEPATR